MVAVRRLIEAFQSRDVAGFERILQVYSFADVCMYVCVSLLFVIVSLAPTRLPGVPTNHVHTHTQPHTHKAHYGSCIQINTNQPHTHTNHIHNTHRHTARPLWATTSSAPTSATFCGPCAPRYR